MKIYVKDPQNIDISESIQRMNYLVDTIPALIKQIPDTELSHKPAPEKWSKKEILGHLVDSASNNHQRFIRIQFQDKPYISYDQDDWVRLSHYNTIESVRLIDFWEQYNRHLLHIIKQIPPENLIRTGVVRTADEEMSLAFYINDYVVHMEYHLRQIVSY